MQSKPRDTRNSNQSERYKMGELTIHYELTVPEAKDKNLLGVRLIRDDYLAFRSQL